MVHAKSEWDVTSITPSSSPASPKRPMYYVQSPRDSQDEADKSSMHTTPAYNSSSPMESPSHPSTYYGRPSNPRSSSASRVSGNWSSSRGNRKRNSEEWQECSAIQEEIDYDHIYGDEGDGRFPCCNALVGFAVVFSAFSLIIWGASRPYNTQVRMESLRVHNFYFGEGSDRTGVPTKLLTVNCTATMSIQNPATFFGIYVSSNQVDLLYSEITVATGELKKYFQPRKSYRIMSVNLDGRRIPLYGAGVTLKASNDGGDVPLKLDFKVQSRGYLVGRLLKTKHHRHISCFLVINSKCINEVKFRQDSCTYD